MKTYIIFLAFIVLVCLPISKSNASAILWSDAIVYLNTTRASISDGSTFKYIDIPGAFRVYVFDKNNNDVILGGYFDSDLNWYNFTYDGSNFSVLSFPDSNYRAYGLNDLGQILGRHTIEGTENAFFYDNGIITDFKGEGSGWTGEDVNNNEVIYGSMAVPSPVPEPSTILLLGTGLLGLTKFARKRFKRS